MEIDHDTLRQELVAIDHDLSEPAHALANALNDMLLQVACVKACVPKEYHAELDRVQETGLAAAQALHNLQAIRDRLARLLEET